MKHLQIAIKVDTDRNLVDGYEINVTPIDIPISDSVAEAVQLAVAVADSADAVPGDGELEAKQHVKVPVKINLFITHLNTSVDVDMMAVVRVVDSEAAQA